MAASATFAASFGRSFESANEVKKDAPKGREVTATKFKDLASTIEPPSVVELR